MEQLNLLEITLKAPFNERNRQDKEYIYTRSKSLLNENPNNEAILTIFNDIKNQIISFNKKLKNQDNKITIL